MSLSTDSGSTSEVRSSPVRAIMTDTTIPARAPMISSAMITDAQRSDSSRRGRRNAFGSLGVTVALSWSVVSSVIRADVLPASAAIGATAGLGSVDAVRLGGSITPS